MEISNEEELYDKSVTITRVEEPVSKRKTIQTTTTIMPIIVHEAILPNNDRIHPKRNPKTKNPPSFPALTPSNPYLLPPSQARGPQKLSPNSSVCKIISTMETLPPPIIPKYPATVKEAVIKRASGAIPLEAP
jgi:hypothetical protein